MIDNDDKEDSGEVIVHHPTLVTQNFIVREAGNHQEGIPSIPVSDASRGGAYPTHREPRIIN